MSCEQGDSRLAERLRGPVTTLRIIVVALASGVSLFAVIAVAIRTGGEPEQQADYFLAWMAAAAAPIAVVASVILPAVIATSARRQIAGGKQPIGFQPLLAELGDAGPLWMVYQTKTIVGGAVLEGAAFFSIVAFLLEGAWFALAIGVGLAGAILAMFPSAPCAADWIERQLRRIDEERLLGR